MKALTLSLFFLFPFYTLGQETSDCLSFKAALFKQVVILLEVQTVFDQALEDHDMAFEEYHQCSSDCSQLKENLDAKTIILSEAQSELEQASEDHDMAFEEYHQCQGTWPVSEDEESS